MAKIFTQALHSEKQTTSEKETPSAQVIRNILSFSKALQVKSSVYMGKVQHVNN